MTKIDQLKEAARKATQGPWFSEGDDVLGLTGEPYIFTKIPPEKVIHILFNSDWATTEDGEYIAAASPDAILDLIQKYEESTKALEVAHIGLMNCFPLPSYEMNTLRVVRKALGLLPAPPNESPEENKK